MATSNRDRIGQMFELMAPPLDQFIGAAVADVLTDGASWVSLVELKDRQKDITGKTYSESDPQVQLRILTENIPHQLKKGWYPFDDALGRVGQGYATELRNCRNAWAHNESFSDDDAYRYLDTGERLMTLVGASNVADEVRAIRLSLRRITADKDDKKVIASAMVSAEATGLRAWRDVLQPHDDVASGNFQAAEFAADLYKVGVTGDAGSDYSDPVQFFSRTYLTEGLRDLLGRAVRRLAGDDNASPVINLQTNFGGGKTHSMLALWHVASGTALGDYPQEMQELLGELPFDELSGIRRVALVGNHMSTSGSTKPDGTQVNTIWGELAWQLGGREAFDLVAPADANSTPPGEALHELLAAYAPCVILIDEWVAYARTLVTKDDLPAGTFDDQFTFAQALTEAVKGTNGALLAISIPASESGDDSDIVAGNDEEVGGAHGQQALSRLQNVVRRVADQWRPASSDEAYHIVRQRLFKPADAQALAHIDQTARAFIEMYHKHADEFPSEARGGGYEDRIKRTYPIHPELFDRLYEGWSTLERFQRTRGVLRLMNTVIHALWVGDDQAPLIMPGSVPIATATVNSELTQYLQDSWKAVIDADVDGPKAEPLRIDKSKPIFGQRSITRRLARTVFFGAAPTVNAATKGIEVQRVFLGTAVPGDTVGNFHSALSALADRATYFYTASGRYWYDLQPNITRQAKDRADRVHIGEVHAEIARRLEQQAKTPGDFVSVHVCPEDSADIIDTDEARLVILHPKVTFSKRGSKDSSARKFALSATSQKGTGNRTNRNMLVFLAGDVDRIGELEGAVRDYLGWSQIVSDAHALNLNPSQLAQAEQRAAKASETTDSRLLGAYQWVLTPSGQPIEIKEAKVEGQATSLGERVSRKLGNDGSLATQRAASLIRHDLERPEVAKIWEQGHVSVGDLWRLYAEYPYMPRLKDRGVLVAGLTGPQLLWEQEGFALANGVDEAGVYQGLVLPDDGLPIAITDETLVVAPVRAKAQRPPLPPPPEPGPDPDLDSDSDSDSDSGAAPSPTPKNTRYWGSTELAADKAVTDFKKLYDEILSPLGAVEGVTLRITVEIEAVSDKGFSDAKVRTISENARELKFGDSGFESK